MNGRIDVVQLYRSWKLVTIYPPIYSIAWLWVTSCLVCLHDCDKLEGLPPPVKVNNVNTVLYSIS